MVSRTDQKSQPDVTLTVEATETPKEPQTFTQAQVDDQVRKGRNAALADVGRLQKESANAIKAANAAQERIKQMLKEQEDAELEAAQGDAELRSPNEVKERHLRRHVQSELDTARQELNLKDERLKQLDAERGETLKAQTVSDVALRLGVDADRLAKLAKFTDGTLEAIEDIAKELPKKEIRPPVRGDSSVTTGGTSQTVMQIQQDYIAGRISNVQYADKMKAIGQQP